jgi:tetratricopeptide (TPR) repeat protein
MRATAAAIGLACVIWFVYAPLLGHEFVEFDDPLYVSANAHVARGLSVDTVGWAFTNDVAFVWHPLTWLSYLVDAELYGIERAGPWLVTNVVLHALAAAALLAALAIQTGRLVPAILVAGFFALHPLQVEAVAWVSARKEVLAGLFGMLTLGAYGAYAAQPSRQRYGLVLLGYAACLLAKGTLLGFPLVLLAFDVWPLGRIRWGQAPTPPESHPRAEPRTPRALALEKLPLLALAAADLAIQLAFVSRSANVWGHDPPLIERIPIAIMGLGGAIQRVFWPTELTLSYPTPMQMGLEPWSTATVAGVAGLLAAIGVGALALARRAPALAVGVFWFFVLLAPLSGLVPAGLRSMHDRYTYVPLAGMAIALVYGLPLGELARRAGTVLAAVALIVCAYLSHQQALVWSDSESLFRHALNVTEHNAVVRFSRGIARAKAERTFEAIADLEAALAVHPTHADAHVALGHLLTQQGDLTNAMPHLERAVALRPGWPLGLTNLARALEAQGDSAGALARFEAAVAAAPDSADAHYWLGTALARRARPDAARQHLSRALEIQPEHVWARDAMRRLQPQLRRTGGVAAP